MNASQDHANSNASPHNPIANLLFLGLLALMILFNGAVLWVAKDRVVAGYGDFAHFYASALIVRKGQGEKLYDYSTQKDVQHELFSQVEIRTEPMVFNHPAYETLMWVPLAFLPYPTAIIVWTIINALMLALLSLYLPRHLPGLRAAFPLPWLLLMFAFYPVIIALIQGQDSIMLFGLYALAFVGLRKNMPHLAGFTLAFGLFKPHLVLPFVLIFLLNKQWQFVRAFVASAIIPLSISVYITGWQGSIDYIRFLLISNRSLADVAHQARYSIAPSAMPNVRGLFYLFLAGSIPESLILTMIGVCSVGLLAWTVRLWRNEKIEAPLDWNFSVAIVLTILVSYHLLAHDAVLLLLPMLILANHLAAHNSCPQSRHKVLGGALIVLMVSPLYLILTAYGLLALMTLVIIFLTGVMSVEITRLPQASERLTKDLIEAS